MAKKLNELSPEEQELRKQIRGATLSAPSIAPRKLLKWNGFDVEVRSPTLAEQQYIERVSTSKDGERDTLKALTVAVMKCVVMPGTDAPVFEIGDEQALANQTMKDFIGVAMKAITELNAEATLEGAEKN